MAQAIATGAGVALGDEVVQLKLLNRRDRHAMESNAEVLGEEQEVVCTMQGNQEDVQNVENTENIQNLDDLLNLFDFQKVDVQEPGGALNLWSSAADLGMTEASGSNVARTKVPRLDHGGEGGSRGLQGGRGGSGQLRSSPVPLLKVKDDSMQQEQDNSADTTTNAHGEKAAGWMVQGRSNSHLASLEEQHDEERWGEISGDISTPPLRRAPMEDVGEQISAMMLFEQKLVAQGVRKVTLSGLRNGQHGSMRLPDFLLAPVERSDLLFLHCSEGGGVLATTNFYLARARGLPVFDAQFLTKWSSSNSLPQLGNFPVFSSCLSDGGQPKPLQPLHRMLFQDRKFCVLSEDASSMVVRQLVKILGGVVVPVEEPGRARAMVYTLSDTSIAGQTTYHQDWILDSVEVGFVLSKEHFLLEPMEQEFCSQVNSMCILSTIKGFQL